MSTAIQWTDRTWNIVTGCTRVSAGCANCYASTLHNSRYRRNVKKCVEQGFPGIPSEYRESRAISAVWEHLPPLPFPQQYDTPFAVVRTWEHKLREPLSWRKPSKVFTCSMGDLFHEDVPFEFLDRVFAVMALTPHHTYQMLTKRPERMREYVTSRSGPGRSRVALAATPIDLPNTDGQIPFGWPLPNVWLGTSVEDQEAAHRIDELRKTPAAVRFLSLEPLLAMPWANQEELIDLFYGPGEQYPARGNAGIDWVIVGGESGKGARPCDVGWIRSIREQCRAAGVPVFVKQLGSVVVGSNDDGFEGDTGSAWPEGTRVTFTEGGYQGAPCLVKLRHSHGGDMEEWPEDLRVREFPRVGGRTTDGAV